MSLEKANEELLQKNQELMGECEQISESSKSIETKMYALWEQNVGLEDRCSLLSDNNAALQVETQSWQSSTKSMEDKLYVMNQFMDDLITGKPTPYMFLCAQ